MYSVSVALPGSIIENAQSIELKTYLAGQDLKYAGLLNPLDCPHHVRQDEKSQFREGVVTDKKPKNGEGSLVNAGLTK
ncbi:13020_t:CDS:2, partial [Acaulospora colombiana]